jgi:hypothetical protein
MAVIFVVIFLPIILVTSYYISLQVDTIKLQESYDTKLLDATYDAMSAFELNTANEDLSTEADSLRSIIEASNNIFFNTLATNMGVSNASKSYVQPYIPAMLYTLYDGYYIYSPTSTPEVCTDTYGQTISTDSYGVTYSGTVTYNGKKIGIYTFDQASITYDENSTTTAKSGPTVSYSSLPTDIQQEYGQLLYKNIDGTYSTVLHSISGNANQSTYYKQSYILKSFISYTATYINSDEDINVTVNYTLDNFLTIEGTINNVYYAKSGYLIGSNIVKEITVNGSNISLWTQYSQEILDSYIADPTNYEVTVKIYNGKDTNGDEVFTTISNQDGYNSSNQTGWEDSQSAVQYYVDSWLFSSWVRENLSNVKASDIINNDYQTFNSNATDSSGTNDLNSQTTLLNTMFYVFSNDTEVYPFRDDGSNDPEEAESVFALHRRNVIKNSVTYNLALSMIVFTEWTQKTEYKLPILAEDEWDKILNNVSLVTFMQGLQCGLKIYSNYAIVSSTNNELTVTPSEIYYVPRVYYDDGTVASLDDDIYETAHRIDCSNLDDSSLYLSFKSKEIKYDKIYNKSSGSYIYDHKVYTDYSCIVDSNYTVIDSSGKKHDGNTDILYYLIKDGNSTTANRLKAYRIAVAKERNNLYKSIAFLENSGYQEIVKDWSIVKNVSNDINLSSILTSPLDLSHIAGIDIVIEDTQSIVGTYTSTFTVGLNDGTYTYASQTLPINSTQRRTVSFTADFDFKNNDGSATLTNIKITFGTKTTVKSIKIYYK